MLHFNASLRSVWNSIIASHIIAQNNTRRLAILIDIKGGIECRSPPIFSSQYKQATEKVQVIILQLDTPGGLATVMCDIIRDILTSPIPVIGYVAPLSTRAALVRGYLYFYTPLISPPWPLEPI